MKSLLLLMLFPMLAFGQSYTPFISTSDSSDTWTDYHYCGDPNDPQAAYFSYTSTYYIDGDSTIAGFGDYVKLMRSQIFETGENGQANSYQTSLTYYGGMREKNKRVYFKPAIGFEYLAYDFNLGIGDTMPSPGNTSQGGALRVITSVDSVYVNGAYRKLFQLSSGATIVEGVGASFSLFREYNGNSALTGCYFDMLCYFEYGSPTYHDLACQMTINVEELSDMNAGKLIKTVDLLGRDVDGNTPGMVIEVYDNGTSKKVYKTDF